MVAFIGNIVNKFFVSSSFSPSTMSTSNDKLFLPSVSSINDIGIDKSSEQAPAFSFKVRGRKPTSTTNFSRESSMVSSGRSTLYHERMDLNIDSDITIEELTPKLFYKTEQEKALQGSIAANQQETMRPKDDYNEASPTHSTYKESIINIQISYDIDAPTELELWSGSFHPISLHRSIEHFALDSKNIKVTLNHLAKYIKNKQVNSSNANKLSDFNGMEDTIWNFISSVYESKWDSLHTDQKTNTLRAKISSKFTPRIPPPNRKDVAKSVPVSINKVLPPPPLPAKTKKEVNVISKYFYSKKSTDENTNQGKNNNSSKSYAQASKPSTNTLEVLKIKETFLSLNTKKIDQVNSIVNG